MQNKRSQDHNILASLLSLGFSVVMMSAMIAMLLTAFFMMPFIASAYDDGDALHPYHGSIPLQAHHTHMA